MCENIESLKKCRGEHNRGKPDFARGNSLEGKERSYQGRRGGVQKVGRNEPLVEINRKCLQNYAVSLTFWWQKGHTRDPLSLQAW